MGKYSTATFTFEGKRYYCRGSTPQEAREKARVREALLKAQVREVRGSYTVEAWAKEWLATYKESVEKNWRTSIQIMIDKNIVPHIGAMPLKKVRPIDIMKVTNSLSRYSESYARKNLLVLKQIFAAAEENDLVAKDPAKTAKLPKCGPNTTHRPITPYERELTLRAAKRAPDDGLFFLIMLYCGCRPQEVSALRLRDFDLQKKVLHVRRARKADGTIGPTKSKAGVRDIPVPQNLIDALPKKRPDEYVCTNVYGDPLCHESSQRMWKRFKRVMELEHGTKTYRNALVDPFLPEDLTPYCYRHTYCTDLQDAGVPLAVAARLMGHADISLTAQIYTHASEGSFEDARAKIEAHLEKVQH